MEQPDLATENVPVLLNARLGEFPVLNPEAISAEGTIEGLVDGEWKFVASGSIGFDKYQRTVMVDTLDPIPEDQSGSEHRFVVMKTPDGYVVDCRYSQFELVHRPLSKEGGGIEAYERFGPVAPIAVAYTNRLTGEPDLYAADKKCLGSLLMLMDEVNDSMQALAVEIQRQDQESRQIGATAAKMSQMSWYTG